MEHELFSTARRGDSAAYEIRVRLLEIAERLITTAFKERDKIVASDRPDPFYSTLRAEDVVSEAEKLNAFVSGGRK